MRRSVATLRPRTRPQWRDATGQSAVETVLALALTLPFVFAIIMLGLLASTKHMVNWAAFCGVRASIIDGARSYPDGGATDREAVREVLSRIDWSTVSRQGATREGYRVGYPTPFAFPLFNDGGNLVDVYAVTPVVRQPDIPETGDNAAR